MNVLERTIDARNNRRLLSAAVRLQLNDVTWSEALSLEQTRSFGSRIVGEESYAHFGMPNEFMQNLNEAHIMLVNAPIAACAIDQIGFSTGVQEFVNVQHSFHYLIFAAANRALRSQTGGGPSPTFQIKPPSNVGIWAWLDIAPGSPTVANFETAFRALRAQTNALPDYTIQDQLYWGLTADRTNDLPAIVMDVSARALESPVAAAISNAVAKCALDDDARRDAQRAADEAGAFATRELSTDSPRVMIADDGTVMLQWRNADRGVLLLFTGDGTASYSIKHAGGLYATNRAEFSLKDRLPAKVRSAIDEVVGS